ncbi:MAG: hypothetical protein ACRCU9_08230, partial [Iodobacter sp.]
RPIWFTPGKMQEDSFCTKNLKKVLPLARLFIRLIFGPAYGKTLPKRLTERAAVFPVCGLSPMYNKTYTANENIQTA